MESRKIIYHVAVSGLHCRSIVMPSDLFRTLVNVGVTPRGEVGAAAPAVTYEVTAEAVTAEFDIDDKLNSPDQPLFVLGKEVATAVDVQ